MAFYERDRIPNTEHRIPITAMSDFHDLVIKKIKKAFPDAIEEVYDFRGERTAFIDKRDIVDVAKLLRDDEDLEFKMLEDIVADGQ